MNRCLRCGKLHSNPKFCSGKCSAAINNAKRKILRKCIVCSQPLKKNAKKFCSIKCQANKQYSNQIDRWKTGKTYGGANKGRDRTQRYHSSAA